MHRCICGVPFPCKVCVFTLISMVSVKLSETGSNCPGCTAWDRLLFASCKWKVKSSITAVSHVPHQNLLWQITIVVDESEDFLLKPREMTMNKHIWNTMKIHVVVALVNFDSVQTTVPPPNNHLVLNLPEASFTISYYPGFPSFQNLNLFPIPPIAPHCHSLLKVIWFRTVGTI